MKVIWKPISKSIPKNENDAFSLLLKNRKIVDNDEFLNPKSPLDYPISKIGISDEDLQIAVNRILKAQKQNEDVVIFGDYDADGVTATAILWEVLHKIGLNVYPFIPERISQGYGLNFDVYEDLIKKYKNLKLIITVDNGIVAHSEIQKFQKKGIDVIVTDHHKKDTKKNKALAVIHSEKICGAGVSWFFAREILKATDAKYDIYQALELVLIGTIADQMDLREINRSFVVHGLKVINQTKRVGLLSLLKLSEKGIFEISEKDIGYFIAPKINAMGRIAEAMDALRLICTKDKQRAIELAKLVYETNGKRQDILVESTQIALQIANEKTFDNFVFVYDEIFHEGITGLIASKLVEEYSLPSAAISINGDFAKGSIRVPDSRFDAVSALRAIGTMLIAGGGHSGAAGFTVLKKDLHLIEKIISEEFNKQSSFNKDVVVFYDFEIISSLITKNFYENYILKLKPFGNGNETPLFYAKFDVFSKSLVGGDKHLKLKLKYADQIFDAIAFGKGHLFSHILINNSMEILFSIDENNWNNRTYLQLLIKDIK